ncbi:MAG: hypothetical protein ABJA61_02795 [Caldimonas sp.]
MPCTEASKSRVGALATSFAAAAFAGIIVAGCSSERPAPGDAPGRSTPPAARPAPAPAPAIAATPAPAPAGVARRPLPPPGPVRNWDELRRQAAQRLVAASPDITYMGKVPDQLLAIPVIEIELNGDGSIRRIEILRAPREAKDTQQIAIDAIRRAAPFGDVARLPKPWKFVETFLFDESRKFKPRTLD